MKTETVLSVMKDVRDLLRKFGVEMAPDEITGKPCADRKTEKTARFVDNGDGTVLDTMTKAVHLQDTHGTVWDSPMTWQEAKDNAAKMTFAGHSDWRLPNVVEEVAILDYDAKDGVLINPIFKGQKADYYWTSQDCVSTTTYALLVGFDYGVVSYANKTNAYCVRPVRGGR